MSVLSSIAGGLVCLGVPLSVAAYLAWASRRQPARSATVLCLATKWCAGVVAMPSRRRGRMHCLGSPL